MLKNQASIREILKEKFKLLDFHMIEVFIKRGKYLKDLTVELLTASTRSQTHPS